MQNTVRPVAANGAVVVEKAKTRPKTQSKLRSIWGNTTFRLYFAAIAIGIGVAAFAIIILTTFVPESYGTLSVAVGITIGLNQALEHVWINRSK